MGVSGVQVIFERLVCSCFAVVLLEVNWVCRLSCPGVTSAAGAY